MCCIIFSELKKLNAKFFGKVRIITQSIFSRKVWFQFLISQRIFSKTYFQHKGYRQSSVRFSIITQNFPITISINFFRKNRREAFGLSSENMLHTTSKYHQIYTTFFNFKTILQVFSYHLYQPCDLTDSVSYQQQFSLNAYKQSWFLYSNAPAPRSRANPFAWHLINKKAFTIFDKKKNE